MTTDDLSRILKQVPKRELTTILSKWGKIPSWKIDVGKGKLDVVKQVCHLAKVKQILTLLAKLKVF